MCLYILGDTLEKTAKKDIVVYKVIQFHKKKFGFSKYISPYRGANVKWKRILKENNPLVLSCSFYDIYFGSRRYTVDIGFHSFSTIEEAMKLKDKYLSDGYTYEIARCVIPKGAKYLEGIWNFNNNMEGMVSNKIKYLKIV